jgi:hypothetical protein
MEESTDQQLIKQKKHVTFVMNAMGYAISSAGGLVLVAMMIRLVLPRGFRDEMLFLRWWCDNGNRDSY